jgi:hypothetical protein
MKKLAARNAWSMEKRKLGRKGFFLFFFLILPNDDEPRG